MIRQIFIVSLFLATTRLAAGIIEKTWHLQAPVVQSSASWHTIVFHEAKLSGKPGEPTLPWFKTVLLLPPGEAAVSIEVFTENPVLLNMPVRLYPYQPPKPLSDTTIKEFALNEAVYRQHSHYPSAQAGHLMTQYLNGFSFALCTFTPVSFIPATGALTWYRTIRIRVITEQHPEAQAALLRLPGDAGIRSRVRSFAQNPEMESRYPFTDVPAVSYQHLIVSPPVFSEKFGELTSMYASMGISCRVITTDSIYSVSTGYDNAEKIRNFIIGQYQNHSIQYVLLAGNPPLIPYRGFYCHVQSGNVPYEEYNIPADLYFSGIDGNYDANGNHIYAEISDNPDLLPDLAVGRFTVNDTAELRRLIHKTVQYQTNPVPGELNKPLLAAEYLYHDPVTFGGPFMELLVDDHNDNGYFTHGIPSASNVIDRLYDTLISPPLNIWYWPSSALIAKINQGRSFVHHLGHANTTYMLKMGMSAISNTTFYAVNGIDHNYTLVYTQGCNDGAFDAPGGCIAAKSVSIDNFLVAGIFNSRYGWFNQGTTDGPSEHLHREFVSALYHDTVPEERIGHTHRISKIETAPWVSLPGEFEPGAQRWVHYCCNVLGDPALAIWTTEPTVFTPNTWTGAIDNDWHKAGNWSAGAVPTSLYDVTIAPGINQPVVNTVNAAVCRNLTIQSGATLTIQTGKSIIVRGDIILQSP